MEEVIVEEVTARDGNGCADCGSRMKWRKMHKRGGGMLYFLGFIGAAVYYVQGAPTFWAGVVGVLKAAVWPAFLVYHLLSYLGV